MTKKNLTCMAATAASAALFFFGVGLHPVAALAWLAPLPILLLAPRCRAKTAAASAFAASLLGSTNSWDYFLRSLSIPLPAALVIVLGSAAVFAAATLVFRALLANGRPLLAAIAVPSIWVTALYGASLASPTGVIGTLSTTQADFPAVIQVASITGAWGIEFLVILAPAALAVLAAPGIPARARLRAPALLAVTLAAVLGYGFARLSTVDEQHHTRRVAVLARTDRHWAVDVATPAGRDLVQSYVDAIEGLPDGVRIVVLPEGSFAADESSLPLLTGPLTQAARAKGTDIVAGLIDREKGVRFNTALDLRATGAPLTYRKWNTGGAPDIEPGRDLSISDGVALEVCMDVNFPRPSRDYGRLGAGLAAIPASDEDVDGWQHSRAALLRAVENGFGVAWSAQRGMPTLTDAHGRVLAETHTGGPSPFAVAVADVPAGTGPTFYARSGDWFAWLSTGLALVTLAGLRFSSVLSPAP
ncbi:nitrilase-related carbon-nitrogen hydrolase [Amycolatopsis pigmentata]|uniref:Nitrilase-related carbon-nitrogen hydrolase n=1 Tax=Amycolatopsis pigmentata TaxID=450801 RepID=A0ABW5G4R3_9PSEU